MERCRCLPPVVRGWVKPLVSPFWIRPAEGLACGRALPWAPRVPGRSLEDPSSPSLSVLSLGASPDTHGSMYLKPRILRLSATFVSGLNSGPKNLLSEFLSLEWVIWLSSCPGWGDLRSSQILCYLVRGQKTWVCVPPMPPIKQRYSAQ